MRQIFVAIRRLPPEDYRPRDEERCGNLERLDTKILETMVQLDDGHELRVGLRVDSFVIVSRPQ
jgi:hypothetical protein